MFLSKLCLWQSILVSTAYCSFKNPYCPIIYQGEISILDKLFEILSLVLLNNIPVPFIIIWVPQMFAIYTHTICFILYHHAFYWWKNSTLNPEPLFDGLYSWSTHIWVWVASYAGYLQLGCELESDTYQVWICMDSSLIGIRYTPCELGVNPAAMKTQPVLTSPKIW